MEKKMCVKCSVLQDIVEFMWRSDRPPGAHCKACRRKVASEAVTKTRRKNKAVLVAEHGSKCVDCGEEYPPYVMDFDHRDPTEKSFGVGYNGVTRSLAKMREEARKCDLVCSNCHRERTHRQRCTGCEYCSTIPM